jgi:hypothetical protein
MLPCEPPLAIRYLLHFAEELNARTLALRLTALSQWHVFPGFADPTTHPDVRKTLKGIARTHGKPKKKARALPIEDLETMLASMSNAHPGEPAQQGAATDRVLRRIPTQ